jgi:hypothetical protein
MRELARPERAQVQVSPRSPAMPVCHACESLQRVVSHGSSVQPLRNVRLGAPCSSQRMRARSTWPPARLAAQTPDYRSRVYRSQQMKLQASCMQQDCEQSMEEVGCRFTDADHHCYTNPGQLFCSQNIGHPDCHDLGCVVRHASRQYASVASCPSCRGTCINLLPACPCCVSCTCGAHTETRVTRQAGRSLSQRIRAGNVGACGGCFALRVGGGRGAIQLRLHEALPALLGQHPGTCATRVSGPMAMGQGANG